MLALKHAKDDNECSIISIINMCGKYHTKKAVDDLPR